ncbi:MAG: hypothetical protein K0S09_895 [Sphingobacteriaceae bacterium]|jgi:hypothetical protein|nr:hypothetical protein [Sphingobacteriaceae bacterium]
MSFAGICQGQKFTGKSSDGNKLHLKINEDSTLILASTEGGYSEFEGKIKKISGDLFTITWHPRFSQGVMMAWQGRTNYSIIFVDSLLNFKNQVGKLMVKYAGKVTTYDSVPDNRVRVYYDKANSQTLAQITTNHRNLITNELVSSSVASGSNVVISSLSHIEPETFRVVWKGSEIWTIGEYPRYSLDFHLKRID